MYPLCIKLYQNKLREKKIKIEMFQNVLKPVLNGYQN